MATIKEIAELAGVSRGTVDRVLNGRGAVSEQTERKVLEIAQALQYRPNRAGIVLAARKRNLKIGVLLLTTAILSLTRSCLACRKSPGAFRL